MNGTTTPIAGCGAVSLVAGTGPTSLTATCVTAALQAGGNSIAATITSDSNFVGATTGATPLLTISTANTTLTATVSPSPSAVDTPVTITGTLSSTFPFTTSPTGEMTFTDANGVLCDLVPVSTTTHTATCTTSSLVAPSDVITVSYGSGDLNFNNSTATPITQIVSKDVTSTVLVSSLPTTAVVNQQVTFTATITPNNASATGVPIGGSVTFTKGGATVCTTAVVSPNSNGTGTAFCNTNFTTAFPATGIIATYSGDSNFTTSVSPSTPQTVLAASTTTTVASPTNPSTVNQSVNLTATIGAVNGAPGFPGTAFPQTGTVSFSDTLDVAGSPFCSTPIVGGAPLSPVPCTHTFTTAGNHVITATFASTDPNFTGSTSTSITQLVNASGTTGITVGTTTPTLTVNQNGTFTLSFTPAITGHNRPERSRTLTRCSARVRFPPAPAS